MTIAQGMLEALTSVIGESDGAIGGILITRLTQEVTDGVDLAATYTWDGTTTVLSGDTSEVAVGDYIRLAVDGQYFEITAIDPNVSVTIDNPNDLVIPSGSTLSTKAVTSIPVESTLAFTAPGTIAVDGVVYHFASKTNTSFDSITYQINGVTQAGVQRLHRVESVVYNRNRDINALDLVRRAMLVEYAEGEDLNTLGRNLGVLRSPFLGDDDQFREIIKVLAYNPRGTLYGLELALTGLVGAGNFEIYENMLTDPGKVFITLAAASILADEPQGAAYLSEAEVQPADSLTQVTLDHDVVDSGIIRDIRLAPEDLSTPTTDALPTAQTWEPYPGATPVAVWTSAGSLGVSIVSADGGALEFQNTEGEAVQYEHEARVIQSSKAVISLWIKPLDNGSGLAETTIIANLSIHDGAYPVKLGWTQSGTGGSAVWQIGWLDAFDEFLAGAISVPIDGIYHELRLEHAADDSRRWYWDGVLQQSRDDVQEEATTQHTLEFGYNGVPTADTPEFRIKEVYWDIETDRSYWAAQAADGSVSTGTRTLTNATITFIADDVGNGFRTYDSAVTNAQGGNNNGRWLVESQTATDVVLIGQTWMGASVDGAEPLRITVPLDQQLFQYPDDLGKEIEILDSELGNNGVYVIDKLLDPYSLTDIEAAPDPVPIKTRYCEVVSASFVSETDLSFRLRPNFEAETNLPWELQDAGSIAGDVVTMRQGIPSSLPSVAQVLAIVYAQVLSAVVLEDASSSVTLITEDPAAYSHYPFYLSDPLGYARDYLSSITAAGIIPDFSLD